MLLRRNSWEPDRSGSRDLLDSEAPGNRNKDDQFAPLDRAHSGLQEFRELSRRKLERQAKLRGGKLWKLRTCFWAEARWEKFNQELFDLSAFVRDLQSPFTTWFNLLTKHQGRLWWDRFKCEAPGTGGNPIPSRRRCSTSN